MDALEVENLEDVILAITNSKNDGVDVDQDAGLLSDRVSSSWRFWNTPLSLLHSWL